MYVPRFFKKGKGICAERARVSCRWGRRRRPHTPGFRSLPPPGGWPSGCYQRLAGSSPRGPTRRGFGGGRGVDPATAARLLPSRCALRGRRPPPASAPCPRAAPPTHPGPAAASSRSGRSCAMEDGGIPLFVEKYQGKPRNPVFFFFFTATLKIVNYFVKLVKSYCFWEVFLCYFFALKIFTDIFISTK